MKITQIRNVTLQLEFGGKTFLIDPMLAAKATYHGSVLLESTSHSIEAIADSVGFQSAVTFRQQFKQRFSVSPTDWRKTFQDKSSVR